MISDIPQIIIYKNLLSSDKYYPLPKIGSEYIFAPRHNLYSVSSAIHWPQGEIWFILHQISYIKIFFVNKMCYYAKALCICAFLWFRTISSTAVASDSCIRIELEPHLWLEGRWFRSQAFLKLLVWEALPSAGHCRIDRLPCFLLLGIHPLKTRFHCLYCRMDSYVCLCHVP